jgi:SNF2 family DNA or RNA helicase
VRKTVTYGTAKLHYHVEGGEQWTVEARPHVAITLKRLFPRAWSGQAGAVCLKHNEEVCRTLEWFMQRYPLELDPESAKAMKQSSRRHRETIARLEDMIDPNYKAREFALAIPARIYQRQAAEIFLSRGSMLLADDVGLGKTATAICALTEPSTRPAVVVTLAGTMPKQWEAELHRFLPGVNSHILKKGTPYTLPKFMGRGPDVVILNYHKLDGWRAVLAAMARTVIFDEVQELRHSGSAKYEAATEIAQAAKRVLGLSATPIYNYGGEIWNVLNVIRPDALGTYEEFDREWCSDTTGFSKEGRIRDPRAFGSYLREHFLMLRRTRSEVGRELPPVTRITQEVDSETEALEEVKGAAAELAKIILRGTDLERGDTMQAAGELDWRLRQATGVDKAPHVADFVRILVENGERVLVYAWHHAVYEILRERLADYDPAMFTGQQSTATKLDSRERFMEGKTPILLMSLRAGAGVDGLQKACRTVVFAELDWSPGVHEQCIGRVARDGQTDPVTVYFLVSEQGSDPVVSEALGIKRAQVEGIRNPAGELVEDLQTGGDRARSLASYFLKKIGDKVPETGSEVLHG